MTQDVPGAPRAASVNPALLPNPATLWRGAVRFVSKTLVIAELEARKLRHDPTEIFTRAVQPALWLLVFGQVFTNIRAIPTGGLRYIDFMAPGILAQSILFMSIFTGITVIWERDLGIVHKFLVTPVPRTALVLGKGLSAGVRALSQVIIIYGLALLVGVNLNWNPLALLGVPLVAILGAVIFSTFSLIIGSLLKTREGMMGIGQVLTMPLFFASNAIYPVSIMPGWLQVIACVNPLSYEVDALRALMVGQASAIGLGVDLLVLLTVASVLVILGGRLYPNVVT